MNIADFSFLRPLWLLLLLLLPALWWLQHRQRAAHSVWQQTVDKHLLAHLLQHSPVRGAGNATRLGMLVAALAIVAMAGPSWRQQNTPLWQLESPLVIALDLSSAMRAADLPPTRLIQARAKLNRLLEQRAGGQVGLLVFAGDAFTVAPITRDARTVRALVDSLDPALMPVDGQSSQRAIRLALKMLRDTEATRGEILLLSDRAEPLAISAAAGAKKAGFSVSVLGVGTEAGAPLTGANGFITGPDGQPQLAKLDANSLTALASAGGGSYARLSVDDGDLVSLGVLDPMGRASDPSGDSSNGKGEAMARSDDGYWLLLLLLPLVLFGFRRGWLSVLTLLVGLSFLPPEQLSAADANRVEAPTPSATSPTPAGWDALWQRADQRAYRALSDGEAQLALELAPNPALKGAAAYRSDDFAGAEQAWAADDSADGHYNRGTALAKAGKLQEALKSLNEALARQPDMEDALANRKAIEDFLKQQQQQQQSGQKSDPNSDQQDQSEQDQSKQDQSQSGQSGDQQSADQQEKEQSDSSEGEQQQGAEQEGESQSADSTEQEGKEGEQSKEGDERQAQSPENEGAEQKNDQDGASADEKKSEQQRAAQAEQVRAAEEAAKRDMQKALDAAQQSEQEAQEAQDAVPMTAEERAQAEQQQATKQWLRRVPDDPGGLLRRKFEMEYRRRLAEGDGQ